MVEGDEAVALQRVGLLDLFRELTESSPRRRTEAVCKLVLFLLNTRNLGDAQASEMKYKGLQYLPGVAAVDAQKVHRMLSAPEGDSAVPYDLQYAVNRLFQGLASPSPCTRQAYALALLLLLLQLQHQIHPVAHVNLLAVCQNLRRLFAIKQAAPSEAKQLHIGRCLGVYVLLSLGFFRKKQCLPEVTDVLEMLWEAFHGKIQLQEASGFLIRQVLRQLAEAGEGDVGLQACERRFRGIVASQCLPQTGSTDGKRATDLGKTATGRLPYSLLEVYAHLQADMQQGWLPEAEWLSTDIFGADNLPSLAAFLSDTAGAHPRLHGLWRAVIRLLFLRRDAEELFVRLWGAVESKLFPLRSSRASHHAGADSKRTQEQSHQSAFVGFRAALLLLQLIKQQLLLPEAAGRTVLTKHQLQEMGSAVFTKGKGFVRALIANITSPRSPLQGVARFTLERLEEVFSCPGQLGAAQEHPLSVSSSVCNSGKSGFIKIRELSSLCRLSCGCQVDPYAHGILEPFLGEARNEAEHPEPFGADFKMLSEPLTLQAKQRVAMMLVFGESCRFQPLKRQLFWRLCSICFSSAGPEELKDLAVLLLAALNETPSTDASSEEQSALAYRRAAWLLDSLLALPQVVGSKGTDGCRACLPDWLLATALCSSWSYARIVSAKKQSSGPWIYAVAVESGKHTEAQIPTTPEGMENFAIPMAPVQLSDFFLFDLDPFALGISGRESIRNHFLTSASRSRIQGKICYLLGSFCSTAMDRCTLVEGCRAENFVRGLHGAHAQVFHLMGREKSDSQGDSRAVQIRAKVVTGDERQYKAKVQLTPYYGFSSTLTKEDKDTEDLHAFCYFASGQGAAIAIAAAAAAREPEDIIPGFVAAADVISIAVCTLSLLPYLLSGGSEGMGTSENEKGSDDEEPDANGLQGEELAASKIERTPARVNTQTVGLTREEELDDLLDASLHALSQLLQVISPLYAYFQLRVPENRDAAVAAVTKAAAISSRVLLLGGNSAASGLLRGVAVGLWKSFCCFAPSASIKKLLGVATATSESHSCSGRESSDEEERSEGEATIETEDSADKSEGDEDSDESEKEEMSGSPRLHSQCSKSNGTGYDGDASSADESDSDPFAVQLSADAAVAALADDTLLSDAYCPPGGFKDPRVSQRKLVLRQRQRFGELRLRALAALQVYVQFSSCNPLALHVLTSLYAAFSPVLLQAAQSRRRKQNLAVYDDLATKIRRTIDLALKRKTQGWQWNSSTACESSGCSKPQRRASSIFRCYQALQQQRLWLLLDTEGVLGQRELKRNQMDGEHQLRCPPLMPTLEDGDRMQILLEGKRKCFLLEKDSKGTEGKHRARTAEQKCLFVAQTLWLLLAEEMVNVLRICSRKLPPQLESQNQNLGVDMLMQLHKLEQQVYGYCASINQKHLVETAVVCNERTIIMQLVSVALAARSQLRRCHLGRSFFEAFAERRPEIICMCDIYGSAISSRAPFVRRELSQVAFRAYKYLRVAPPLLEGTNSADAQIDAVRRQLSSACVLTHLLSKDCNGEGGRKRPLPGVSTCEPMLLPRKAFRSSGNFAIFVIRRLMELVKETSGAEVKPPQQRQPGKNQQKKRQERWQLQRGPPPAATEEGEESEVQALVFSSVGQKQAAIYEQLKQLQQLLQVFARRDTQQSSIGESVFLYSGFKELLKGLVPSIEETVRGAAKHVGGKKPVLLANAISALLSRIEGGSDGQFDEQPGAHGTARKRTIAEDDAKSRHGKKQKKAKSSKCSDS